MNTNGAPARFVKTPRRVAAVSTARLVAAGAPVSKRAACHQKAAPHRLTSAAGFTAVDMSTNCGWSAVNNMAPPATQGPNSRRVPAQMHNRVGTAKVSAIHRKA